MKRASGPDAAVTRRSLLTGLSLGMGGLALASPLCGPIAHAQDAAPPLRVGFVYDGPRADFGMVQAHADAAQAVATMPGVRVEEIEATPTTLSAAAEELAGGRGCRIVFVTAPGDSLPLLLAQAEAHRDTAFLLCGSTFADARLPDNVGVYDAYMDEGQHIAGIVAGYASRSKRVGLVAAESSPRVLRCVNAFALGVRRADPTVAVRVALVGASPTPDVVAAAAKALVADGADVLSGQLASVRPVCEVAAAAGVRCCGLHIDLSALAPEGFLTGTQPDWTRICADTVQRIQSGREWERVRLGGFGKGHVRSTAYGRDVGVEARAHADAARMQLANGNAAVFRGPILDNTGRVALAKGKTLKSDDPALDRLVWLAEGVEVVR
ncbi:MAG TPA: BMP family ABC transporter substrate-binding protein [Azospirillum sp.]|nr:BMP family ABC transporter substrate-binding protein [Azospirillum sp.]